MFRLSSPKDREQLCEIWQEAFGEGPESAQFVFEEFCGYHHIYVLEENGTITSMLCAVPCFLALQPGIYLYGVATRKTYRGKGLMGRLIEYAEQEEQKKGAVFSALIPQTPDLFHFYRRFGYETQFYRHFFSTQSFSQQTVPGGFSPVSAEELNALRQKFCPLPWVRLDQKALSAIIKDLNETKTQCFVSSNGYAIVRKEPNRIWVEELFASDTEEAKKIIGSINHIWNCGCAEGYCGGSLLSEQPPRAFGMAKYFACPIPIDSAYMALMLN